MKRRSQKSYPPDLANRLADAGVVSGGVCGIVAAMAAFHRSAGERGRRGCALVLGSVLVLVQLGLFAHVIRHQLDPGPAPCVVCLTGTHLDDGLAPTPPAVDGTGPWPQPPVPVHPGIDLQPVFRFFARAPPIPPSL
jgi:hypothetical protein